MMDQIQEIFSSQKEKKKKKKRLYAKESNASNLITRKRK